MDFQDLLAQASHNAKANTKHVEEVERAANMRRQQERRRFESELQREREERKRRAPPKVEKRFVIPKKKALETEEVDAKGIEAFLRKQRQTEMEKAVEKKNEREKLISLRLQANQGRANKKIASQFGKTAVELQQRYAHNSHVEMELIKRQQREEEEIERKGKHIRESINRAMESRAGKLARAAPTTAARGTVRVGNVKAGGFADLSAQHESVTTQRKTGDDIRTASSSRMSEKQRAMKAKRPMPGASNIDFKTLMETAKQNRDATTAAARTDAILKGEQRLATPALSDSREVMKRTADLTRRVQPATKQTPNPKTPQPRSLSTSKTLNPYELSDRRTLNVAQSSASLKTPIVSSNSKNARPMPSIPQPPTSGHSNASMFAAKREQRILPGDLRYKPSIDPTPTPQSAKPKTVITFGDRFRKLAAPSASSFITSSVVNRELPAASFSNRRLSSHSPPRRSAKMAPPIHKSTSSTSDRTNGRAYDSTSHSSTARSYNREPRVRDVYANEYDDEARLKNRKRAAADDRRSGRPLSHPGMFNKGRGHVSTSFISGGMYSDEEEEEDDGRYDDYDEEHDSEMDDFIDDTEVDNLAREDFEESLKLINPHYNKKKWEQRERMIDERQMHSRFRDVEAEEKRSARVALYEDLMEAKRGSKGIT